MSTKITIEHLQLGKFSMAFGNFIVSREARIEEYDEENATENRGLFVCGSNSK